MRDGNHVELFRQFVHASKRPHRPPRAVSVCARAAITSVCSANTYVVEAAMRHALEHDYPLLVECTSNQVNQYGGYTGMTPAQFKESLVASAREVGLPAEQLLLGADHFGPYPWRSLPAEEAMARARELVSLAAAAGFKKIHLDASMPLGSERFGVDFSDETIAARQAELAAAAESAWSANHDGAGPVYVIGSEVPTPGGAQDQEGVAITSPEALRATVAATRAAFTREGLTEAWERVVAVVVQPGVEFGDAEVHRYDPTAAAALVAAGRSLDGICFEGHSTDYQSRSALASLVRDGVAILKVGPALTYAFREAVFLLEHVEAELKFLYPQLEPSRVSAVLEAAMIADPKHWTAHYFGSPQEQAFARRYSLSDRCRYYWPVSEVASAVEHLLDQLETEGIPSTLVSQYFPGSLRGFGEMHYSARELVAARIGAVLDDYHYAAHGLDSPQQKEQP